MLKNDLLKKNLNYFWLINKIFPLIPTEKLMELSNKDIERINDIIYGGDNYEK